MRLLIPNLLIKPVTRNLVEESLPDTDLLEHNYPEHDKDGAHQPGKAAR
jgi:hypothetical protein